MRQVALTKRQLEILDYYREYSGANRMSPTLEEVAQHFGVNKVTIFGHVAELERKGMLMRAGRKVSRGVLLRDARETPDASNPIRILGTIAAGSPIAALENPENLNVSELVPPGREHYALRVDGNSMIDEGIRSGDVVLVERTSQFVEGSLVVAVLPNEHATLKRIYRDTSGYRLQPSNSDLKPVIVAEVEIRGIVRGLVRRYGGAAHA